MTLTNIEEIYVLVFVCVNCQFCLPGVRRASIASSSTKSEDRRQAQSVPVGQTTLVHGRFGYIELSALSSEPGISTSCQQWLEQTAPPTSMLILVHKVSTSHSFSYSLKSNGWFRLDLLMFSSPYLVDQSWQSSQISLTGSPRASHV